MGIRFCVLGSGSTGNATVVATEEGKVLIDAGLSAKKIDQLLKERGMSASELDAIVVTHEHADHIKGLGAVARKYDLPVYANEKTWAELDRQIGEIAEENRCVMKTGEMLEFGSLQVESYGISHDAAEPVGYCFYHEEEKLSVATDLGYMSSKVKEKIQDSDVLVLESNHDIEMLRMGRYPWNIKRRILSDVGHLSNEAAGIGLVDVMTAKTKRVYLAHLSRDHNLMDLARLTVNSMVEERLAPDDHRAKLMDTYHDRSTEWDVLKDD
ncbi:MULTISPECIES: MBL fold metallo-hydrolase [Paenibacillus]|uniref:MBL fold metallo-hydrolase n=1 Tax=Paenibacillus elgii TaxID=189691 RepID=A0A2T6G104_9BACL|nr:MULTISPECIES: MBL fold metallo-hydrolase [Paenibacillus]MCM3271755.1 MBL fold metallo-hydrolase [Paenibacillus elgii]NEN82722.1 MBL fold metallo-hydrolase [Paenibacillus elgii]PUA37815.1 MBL fold metallo-hydrolase [Paenibacillus elgii]GLI07850.1 MBL fold hydrolase [Paenibacillus tyrfis]